jgi:hypothetical protein
MLKTGPKDKLNQESVRASANDVPLVAQDKPGFSLPLSGDGTLSYDLPCLYQGKIVRGLLH